MTSRENRTKAKTDDKADTSVSDNPISTGKSKDHNKVDNTSRDESDVDKQLSNAVSDDEHQHMPVPYLAVEVKRRVYDAIRITSSETIDLTGLDDLYDDDITDAVMANIVGEASRLATLCTQDNPIDISV
ncbi:hypothetical protein QFC21_006339 [Naganishia friedmannii]|uniref:Uncharacterized protein n=1 Tax=Naganishia friedmannii TaxID=89922 RepID=A0ACC2V3C6_9TREE|nr:hypothetical protein QFC21_006339 [Naganishia friedmannii]